MNNEWNAFNGYRSYTSTATEPSTQRRSRLTTKQLRRPREMLFEKLSYSHCCMGSLQRWCCILIVLMIVFTIMSFLGSSLILKNIPASGRGRSQRCGIVGKKQVLKGFQRLTMIMSSTFNAWIDGGVFTQVLRLCHKIGVCHAEAKTINQALPFLITCNLAKNYQSKAKCQNPLSASTLM